MADDETPLPGSDLFEGDLDEDRQLPQGVERARELDEPEEES